MLKFWYKRGFLNYLLLPISFLWLIATYIRLLRKGKKFNPLIICNGNITVGGAGKTPFTIFLAKELQKQGLKVAILSRGYNSNLNKEVVLVNSKQHTASEVGDEAMLLSQVAPLVIAKNRALGAELLAKQKYQIILMDDGLQNPSIEKDVSILLFNTLNPFGNGLIIPAGPLREPFFIAKNRIDLVVGVGKANHKLQKFITSNNLKYLEANIEVKTNNFSLEREYLAFAALAYPDKFFKVLEDNNFKVKMHKIFKDHYLYKDKDIENLIALAKRHNLRLITTTKDYVKINPKYYSFIDNLKINLTLNSEDKDFLINFILSKVDKFAKLC